MLPSRLLERTRQMSPPALPPGQVGLFLPPTRAIFQPLWEKPRAEREECLSTFPSRSRPLCLKTKFSTDVAGSLLGARRYDFKARPTSPDEQRTIITMVKPTNTIRPTNHVQPASNRRPDQEQPSFTWVSDPDLLLV